MSAPKPSIARHSVRVEAALRIAAPLLDLVLATGDRLSRTLSRDPSSDAPEPVSTGGRGRTVGPGPEGSD